jgi:hypothetical protein
MIKVVVVVIIIYLLLLSFQPTRFNKWYPTIQGYPDNMTEIDVMVKEYMNQRTMYNIRFFELTDPSVMAAFEGKISEEQFNTLKEIIVSPFITQRIMFYKLIYNRARPSQVAPERVNALQSKTAATASYPAGHAFQAYYAAKILSEWEPQRKKEWMKIADDVANVRIIAGLHYPSDSEFSRQLVDDLWGVSADNKNV